MGNFFSRKKSQVTPLTTKNASPARQQLVEGDYSLDTADPDILSRELSNMSSDESEYSAASRAENQFVAPINLLVAGTLQSVLGIEEYSQ